MKKQATYGDYVITVEDNNSISVTNKGEACETVKPVLRQVAEKCNFAYEATWTTQQLGNKLVDYLKKNHITTGENASKKNHVRIEIEMPEYEYVALDQDECPIGDTFAFNDACEGFNSIKIYVDGQLLETEDDEIELESEYSDYQSHKLKWDVDEIIYSVGYYENTVSRVWEFEVENFDLEKLTKKWTCYDVSYSDYEAENHHLTLLYDGQELEEDLEGYGCKTYDYKQIWSMDDDEDECYCDDEDMDTFKVKGGNVIIPKGITEIPNQAFYNNRFLTSVIIPDGVTSIGREAFYGCKNLTSVVIPSSVTTIEYRAFFECVALNSVVLTDGLITIGEDAFEMCKSLTNINFPDSIETLGRGCFAHTSLISVVLPKNITLISWALFAGCKSLTSVSIPKNVTKFEGLTFEDCKSLCSIDLPDGITSIGYQTFQGCISLSSINLPRSLTKIEEKTFVRCESLCSIHLPNGITSIGDYAFENCKSLMNINIPSGVTKIGDLAFADCISLKSIQLPEKLVQIGFEAFMNCSTLNSVVIPDSVNCIGAGAFRGCEALEQIPIVDVSINGISFNLLLHNKTAVVISYSKDIHDLVIPSEVTYEDETYIVTVIDSIGYAPDLCSVVIPDSVISISDGVFKDCQNLSSVTIGNAVKHIGNEAFKYCTSLVSITIPDSVTSIGKYAFENCSNLASVTLGNNVQTIGFWAFFYCKSLVSVNIPDSVISDISKAFPDKHIMIIKGNVDVETDDCNIEITPDTIIDDIYIKFTLKYPHLHLRFLSKSGVMEALVDSSLTVKELRKVLGSQYTTNQGTVSLAGNRTVSDLCAELRSYGVGSVWVCCHYSEDMEPEPHGEDRTLSYAESQSLEDAAYMIAGMRKITPEGTIIEGKPAEFSMSLSEKFGILATTLAGMDNNLQKGEVDIALIIARQCDQLNVDEVRTAIFKELKGIQEYESQSKIVKSIKRDDRELIFQYLVLLAISDLTLSQGELQLLGGIADVWGWDWDDCIDMIHCIIKNFQNDNPGKIVKIEE